MALIDIGSHLAQIQRIDEQLADVKAQRVYGGPMRLAGLHAERERLVREIDEAMQPQDDALTLARELQGKQLGLIGLAEFIRMRTVPNFLKETNGTDAK